MAFSGRGQPCLAEGRTRSQLWTSPHAFTMTRLTAAICLAAGALFAACDRAPATTYDLVVANGRVIDPESGVDAVRHVGISGARIEAVSETPLSGTRVIDATGHVVAPGFIDLHEHGQREE